MVEVKSVPKTYVLHSSVLRYSPYALFAFDDNNVIIPLSVVMEMRQLTTSGGSSEVRSNARIFGKLMDSLVHEGGDLSFGVKLKNGGNIKVVGKETDSELAVTWELAPEGAILVTRDPYLRVVANAKGIRAEEFKSEAVALGDTQNRLNRCAIFLSSSEMQAFSDSGELPITSNRTFYATSVDGSCVIENYKLAANEYVVMKNELQPNNGHLFGRFNAAKNAIERLRYYTGAPVFGVQHRNLGQRFLLDALLAPPEEIPLVIACGPAGTGKTFLTLAAALSQTYDNSEQKIYQHILITRANTKMDNDIGYLKGSELEKVMPTLRGALDNIEDLMPEATGVLDELISRKIIIPQAMAYMRGRSVTNTVIIVDEAQNMTPSQTLSMISRAGRGSKFCLIGDPNQIDHPFLDKQTNGLVYAAEGMRGSQCAAIVTFDESECTRSALAAEAIARLTPKGTNY